MWLLCTTRAPFCIRNCLSKKIIETLMRKYAIKTRHAQRLMSDSQLPNNFALKYLFTYSNLWSKYRGARFFTPALKPHKRLGLSLPWTNFKSKGHLLQHSRSQHAAFILCRAFVRGTPLHPPQQERKTETTQNFQTHFNSTTRARVQYDTTSFPSFPP